MRVEGGTYTRVGARADVRTDVRGKVFVEVIKKWGKFDWGSSSAQNRVRQATREYSGCAEVVGIA